MAILTVPSTRKSIQMPVNMQEFRAKRRGTYFREIEIKFEFANRGAALIYFARCNQASSKAIITLGIWLKKQ